MPSNVTYTGQVTFSGETHSNLVCQSSTTVLLTSIAWYIVLGIAVLVTVALVPTVWKLSQRFYSSSRKASLGPDIVDYFGAQEGIAGLDTAEEAAEESIDAGVNDGNSGYIIRPNHKMAFAGKLARECQDHFGFIRDSEPNRLVARKWIQMRMVEMNVRPSHRAGITPFALRLTFIPSRDELDAVRMVASAPVQERLRERDQGVFT
jgi:hypothetical protein